MDKKKRTYMLVGGGSGGHLTPLVAVAEAIKRLDTTANVVYVGQKGENLNEVVHHESINSRYAISAGKFRRYHGDSVFQHLTDIRTILLNFRDFFRFIAGFFQSLRLLRRIRPNVIFLKGGFVCVPVGFAARIVGSLYVTHDSDAIPGLANRLTAKRAVANMTALPAELYPYDKSKTVQVGIPIKKEFSFVSESAQQKAKVQLGLQKDSQVIFCVGGGLGAQAVNSALVEEAEKLLESNLKLHIFHITGKKLFEEVSENYAKKVDVELRDRVHLMDFTTELYIYSAAADIIITRAGATNMAEFAAQSKLCIVIPAPQLTGGQQLHNAKIFEQTNAAVVVQERNLKTLGECIERTLKMTKDEKNKISSQLNRLLIEDADNRIAEILIEYAD